MPKNIEDNAEEFANISEIVKYLVQQGHPLARWFSNWQEDNYQCE